MSEIYRSLRFYFDDADAHATVRDLLGEEPDGEEAIERLGLTDVLDADDDHLESVSVGERDVGLCFVGSTSSSFNHALVRRFGALGSTFCHVDEHNSQVGESIAYYLHRGRQPDAERLAELIRRHDPVEETMALLDGDPARLRDALAAGLDPSRVVDGEPLLVHAFEAGDKAAFDLLLEHGADVGARDADGAPLPIAIAERTERDTEGYLAALVERGADIDAVGEDGGSFLWHLGRADTALRERLVARGAAFLVPSEAYAEDGGLHDLDTALEHHDTEAERRLAAPFMADPARHDELAALFAVHDAREHLEALFVLRYVPGPEALHESLERAACAGALGTVELLLDVAERSGLDLDETAETLIDSLAEHPDASAPIVRLARRHPGSVSRYALHRAIESSADDVLRALLDHGGAAFAGSGVASGSGAASDDVGAPGADDEELDGDAFDDDEFDDEEVDDEEGDDEEGDDGEDDGGEDDGDSLLHEVLECLTPRATITLLERGFDPLATNWCGVTVLERVFDVRAIEPDPDDVEELDEDGTWEASEPLRQVFRDWIAAQPPERALRAGLLIGDRTVLDGVVVDASVDLEQALRASVVRGHAELVAALLERGADADAADEAGNVPLALAVSGGHASCCAALLAAGADPGALVRPSADDDEDDDGVGVLMRAMGLDEDALEPEWADLIHVPERLADASPSVLMVASAAGRGDIVEQLLAAGAAIDARDDNGFSALHHAAAAGRAAVVPALIAAGADVALDDALGNTALHHAGVSGAVDVCALLLDAGAPLEARNGGRNTPLSLACAANGVGDDDAAIALLLARGADVDARDLLGRSPLAIVCRTARMRLIGTLLDAGADTSSISREAFAPIDYFRLHERPAEGFDPARLEPSDPVVGRRKAIARVKLVGFKVATVAAIALPAAYFSLVAGAVLAVIGIAFWVVMHLGVRASRAALAVRASDVRAENPLLGGLLTMGEVLQDVERERNRERDVIDSWDDDVDRAA